MSRSTRLCALFLAIAALAVVQPARAGQADMYGVGAAAMGRGNGGACLENEAASLFYNPAGLALTPFDTFSLGGQIGFPSFADVQGVQPADPARDPVLKEPLAPHGFYISLIKRVAKPVSFALAYTHPSHGFFYYEQEDPYIPTLVRWRNRSQRMALYVGASVRPLPGLMVGIATEISVGARLYINYAWEGYDRDTYNGKDVDDPVALANLRDAEVQIKPAARPIFGLLFDFGQLHDRLEGLRFGVTFRGVISLDLDPTELEMELTNPGALEWIFQATTKVRATAVLTMVDFYTPSQATISLGWDRPRFAAFADLTWNDYSEMIPNTGMLAEGREGDGGMEVHWATEDEPSAYGVVDGRLVPSDAFRDTWTVRGGVEIRTGKAPDILLGKRTGVTIRLGGAYDPPIVRPQAGPSNLIDASVVTGTAGVGLSGPDPLGLLAGNGSLDLALQVHRALPTSYDKDHSLIPEGVAMPVSTDDQVCWCGGWMVAIALNGTLRW